MPSRYLRPEIRTSRRWNACSWCAQSLYIRLITLVDDFGRYEADPVILCSEAFPTFRHFRPGKVTKLLAELHANDLIRLYQHDGKTYLQITRWKERIRSTQSKFPAPPGVQNEHSANGNGCKQGTSQTALRTIAATAPVSLPPQPTPSPQPQPTGDVTNNTPSLEQVQAYFESLKAHGADYTPAEARQVFLSFESTKDANGRWHSWDRRPITDWRAAVEERAGFFRSKQPKKGTHATYQQTDPNRADRNKGTFNEGKAHLYAKPG